MNKLFIALVATAAIGLFSTMTETASAQCGGGGYYRGGGGHYYGGHGYSYQPRTTIGFSYGTGYNNYYRPAYYRPAPAYYGGYRGGYRGGYYGGYNRGYGGYGSGVGFSIRF